MTRRADGGDRIRKALDEAKVIALPYQFSGGGPGGGPGGGADDPDAQAPSESEEAFALAFAAEHAGNVRHTGAWSRWSIYRDGCWWFDETLQHLDLTRHLLRMAAAEIDKPSVAKATASARTAQNVLSLARADRRLAATVDQWDAGPMLLNTPAGTLDLGTGQMRRHSPDDYLTKMTTVAPGGTCPLWRNFLGRVTGGDLELQEFLQRVVGYALTGSVREHALFFLHGTGANGKSVFVSTVAGVLGPYHKTAAMETFISTSGDRHPTDLAGLRGARMVTAVETEEGRRWAESKLKAMTGADKISARFMRQDFFEYTPQFKLIIAGNHKPGLRSVDEAIRRRFHLIPFKVTIPKSDRDPELVEKLQEEWPGILQWAIDGCIAWQDEGLAPPAVVRDATEQYLAAEDALAVWIDEDCKRDPAAWTSTSRLFEAWRDWCLRTGEQPGRMKRFSQHLEARGFDFGRRRDANGYHGLRPRGF